MPEPTCEAPLPLAVIVDTFTAGGGMGDQCIVWLDALGETLSIESDLIKVSCQVPGLRGFAEHGSGDIALPSRPFNQANRLAKHDPSCAAWIVCSHGIISIELRIAGTPVVTVACGRIPIERPDPLRRALRQAIQVHTGESNG